MLEETYTGLAESRFFGILITAAGFVFLDPLVWIMGSTETIAVYAKTYMGFILISAPLSISVLIRY